MSKAKENTDTGDGAYTMHQLILQHEEHEAQSKPKYQCKHRQTNQEGRDNVQWGVYICTKLRN